MPIYRLYSKRCGKLFITFPKCACTTLIKWVATTDGIDEEFGISLDHNNVRGYANIHEFGQRYLSASINVEPDVANAVERVRRRSMNAIQGMMSLGRHHVAGGRATLRGYDDIFVISRSPYNRLLSCFLGNYGDSTWGLHKEYAHLFDGDFSFAQFVDALYQRRIDIDEDEHFKPLTHFLDHGLVGNLDKMNVVRFENLTDELKAITDAMGIEFDYRRIINKTRYRAQHRGALYDVPGNLVRASAKGGGSDVEGNIFNFYDPGIQRKVEQLYRDDFSSFRIPTHVDAE